MNKPESFFAKLPSPIQCLLCWNPCRLTRLHVLDVDLAGREEVNTGNGSVADGDESLVGCDVDAGEVVEVLEESAVGSAHGQLDLGELGQNTEESHLSLGHGHLSHHS